MKKAKNLIIYVINYIYLWNDLKYSDDLYKKCVRLWHLSYRDNDDYELELEKITNFMTEYYTVEQFLTKYDSLIHQYANTFLLINSFYDLDPKPNRAFRYLTQLLINSKLKIFILSLNPYSDITNYFYRPKGKKGFKRVLEDSSIHKGTYIEDIHEIPEFKRHKHSKYRSDLMNFAVDLRRGHDIVTFDTIRKATGIPKPTIVSYAKRNNIELSSATGRSYLNEEEKRKIDEIKAEINREFPMIP